MESTLPSTPRISSLDALRGIAALMVLLNHLQHAFVPLLFGSDTEFRSGTWGMVPAGFLLNGSAAVALFFVLSGFVLTQRIFESGKIAEIPDSILKRWPRLMGPVLIVSLISGCLMAFGLYRCHELACLNGSSWLSRCFNWAPAGFDDIRNAFYQGVLGTFLTGDCSYSAAFWTMHYELLGSIVVYLLAMFVILASRYIDWRLIAIGLVALWIREAIRFPFMAAFILGAILALVHARIQTVVWNNRFLFFCGFVISVLILGFTYPQNDVPQALYGLAGGVDPAATRTSVTYFLYSIVSIFFLASAMWMPPVRDFLSKPFFRNLGHLSFPIYLIHIPVICSAGSWIYLVFQPHGVVLAASLAIFISFLLSIALSVPLASFDDHWLQLVRRITPFGFFRHRLRSSATHRTKGS